MQELVQLVNELRRPRLLLRAARHGLDDYCRERLLRRLLGGPGLPGPARAVSCLIELEQELEAARLDGDAAYSPARHVEVLVALISETRMLSAEPARAAREFVPPHPRRAAVVR